MLAGKGSSGSDRLNVLGDQILHLHFGNSIMDPKEILKIEFGVREISDDVLMGTRINLETNDPKGDVIFLTRIIRIIHRAGSAYKTVSI